MTMVLHKMGLVLQCGGAGATQRGAGATRAMEELVRHNVVLDEGWLRDQETGLRATIS